MMSRCFLDFSVGVAAFVTGPSEIFTFSSSIFLMRYDIQLSIRGDTIQEKRIAIYFDIFHCIAIYCNIFILVITFSVKSN